MNLQQIRDRKDRRKKLIQQELEKIKLCLINMGAIRIIVFGSYANGNVTSYSDLDLIAVMPPIKSGREWMREIYDKIDREVDCDIIAYTEEELENTKQISRFLRHALETGKVVYERL